MSLHTSSTDLPSQMPEDSNPHRHHYQTTHHWIDSHVARVIVGFAILINALNLGVLTFVTPKDPLHAWLMVVDYVTIAIFVMEMGMRLVAHHRHFFHHPWNVFDFTIVALSLIPLGSGAPLMEGIRVLRLFYFLEFSKNLKHILYGLYYAFPGFLSVSFLVLIIFYIYAVFGIALFHDSHISMFQNIGTMFQGLFRVLTGDGWYDTLTQLQTIYPYAWIYFYSYFLVMVLTTINLFVGVVVTALQSAEADVELPRKNSQKQLFSHLSVELKHIQHQLKTLESMMENTSHTITETQEDK